MTVEQSPKAEEVMNKMIKNYSQAMIDIGGAKSNALIMKNAAVAASNIKGGSPIRPLQSDFSSKITMIKSNAGSGGS